MQPYTEKFYDAMREGTIRSAKEIIPIVLEFVQPKSVIDVGCGAGIWLSALRECGIEDILGVDGEYVCQDQLEIPKELFLAFDLTKPLVLDRKFDLAISLEVAEHLPPECATSFVDSLTQLAPVILFSAAIPFQGGTGHVNEQWIDYWIECFRDKNYVPVDCMRSQIWRNSCVEYWYAQNMLILIREEYLELEEYSLLKTASNRTNFNGLPLVHPQKYLEMAENYAAERKVAQWYISEAERYAEKADLRNRSLREVLAVLPFLLKVSLQRRFFKASSLSS
ncbi:hypothetical protein C7B61_15405 [filamentous cyanobacterium CCP1]|nr:hypothetical protein C7B76_07095 [filamentous cyanobacterium CCP2]PSB61795.1 hypothetical protein C7B61_15405 [filamentous cyanobacterium CCP1]